MPRKKKVVEQPRAPTEVCPFCGNEYPVGHSCKCKEGMKVFAKKLYDEHYGGKKRGDDK